MTAMASLKEVKERINSVSSTEKITSAMKMVASAKLHKAQAAIGNMLPYEQKLSGILSCFLDGVRGKMVRDLKANLKFSAPRLKAGLVDWGRYEVRV